MHACMHGCVQHNSTPSQTTAPAIPQHQRGTTGQQRSPHLLGHSKVQRTRSKNRSKPCLRFRVYGAVRRRAHEGFDRGCQHGVDVDVFRAARQSDSLCSGGGPAHEVHVATGGKWVAYARSTADVPQKPALQTADFCASPGHPCPVYHVVLHVGDRLESFLNQPDHAPSTDGSFTL
jgi:hypothetical protein